MKKYNTYHIAVIGLMAALVFVASHISIYIPLGLDTTRIHLGNIFCILSGLLLGGFSGGLAAGIGSMFYDFTNPIFLSSAPFTLVFKFLLAYTCGKIAYANHREGNNQKVNFLAAGMGSFLYVVLYVSREFSRDIWFKSIEIGPAFVLVAQRAATSLTNGALAVIIGVPLALVVRKALETSHLYDKLNYDK